MTVGIPTRRHAAPAARHARRLGAFATNTLLTRLALAALAVTVGVIYVSERQSVHWVQHSRQVARDARSALKLAVDDETGIRGYLLARDTVLLTPVRAADAALPALIAGVVAATADNPEQQRRAIRAREAMALWRHSVAEPALTAPARYDDPARRRQWALEGKRSFDMVRDAFADFVNAEDDLYTRRVTRAERIQLGGLLFILAELATLAIASTWASRRMLGQAEEILENNAQLEEQAVELELTMDEARQASRDREEAFAVLDAALGSAPSAFAFVDDDDRVSRRNSAFRALPTARGARDGAECIADLAPDIAERLSAAIRDVRATGRPRTGIALEVHHDGGSASATRRTWTASCYPVVAEGRTVGVGVIATETTAQLRLEAELRQAQKMDAIGQLAGAVAHDFNNVLTVINSYAAMLLQDMAASRERDDVEQIARAGHRAAALTKQLLTFSRKESLQPEPVQLAAVVEGLVEMLRRLIGEDIEVVARTSGALPEVIADPGQLEQVIVNLAVNARDAMPSGGMLLLETTAATIGEDDFLLHPGLAPGEYVVLSVSDTGIGMDAETQARVFEPFFTTKGRGQGTGIGLATVYGIVRQAGGHISLYSEPGEGTTFRIWLPAAPAEHAIRTPSHGRPKATHAAEGAVVLVADDDDAVREVVERVLERRGYTVFGASNGAEALSLCRELAERRRPLDLLISDVIMPEMSGPALVDEVRALMGPVRVLYMSGYTGSHLTGADLPEGVTAFVEKPFTVEALLDRVSHAFTMAPEQVQGWTTTIRSPSDAPGGRAAREMARRAVESERRAAATMQRTLEARHRALMDALQEGVMLVDVSGIIEMSNPSATRAMGGDAPVVGSHLRELPIRLVDEHGTTIPAAEHPVMRALAAGEVPIVVFGTLRLDRDEPVRWWLGRARRLQHGEGGAPFGVAWSFGEITERKRAEDALEKETEFSRAVLENVFDGVIACDEHGVVSLFNRAARELIGRSNVGVEMADWPRHFHVFRPDGTPLARGDLPLARALAGEVVERVELMTTRSDGHRVQLLASARPLRVPGRDTPMGAVVALHDVTLQQQTERELRAALEEARVAGQVKHDFLLQMSHELRTPLNAIIGFSGTMLKNRDGHLGERDLMWLGRIQAAGRQLLRTFEDILFIVDAAGATPVPTEPTDLGALLEDIAGEHRGAHEGGASRLRVERPDPPVVVVTGRRDLHAALDRIVDNAMRFAGGAEVVLRVERLPDGCQALAVQDFGPGIPVDQQARIFQPFTQGDAGASRQHDGAGLGLNVAMTHCRRIGASLTVDSVPGEGAVFRIVLPSMPEAEAAS